MNAVGHIISHKHKGEGMEEEGRSRKKQEEVRKPMDMAFIWQNKYFRIVMWNRCTDYQYYNCYIVFVF